MAVIKAVSSKAGIGQAIDYVTKEEKTEEKLVSGLHCEAETAKEEMQATKELWEKTGGRTYKHFVQSYHKDEKITPETLYSLQRIRRHGKDLRCLWLPIRTKTISIRTLSSIPSILRTGTSSSGAVPTCGS